MVFLVTINSLYSLSIFHVIIFKVCMLPSHRIITYLVNHIRYIVYICIGVLTSVHYMGVQCMGVHYMGVH